MTEPLHREGQMHPDVFGRPKYKFPLYTGSHVLPGWTVYSHRSESLPTELRPEIELESTVVLQRPHTATQPPNHGAL